MIKISLTDNYAGFQISGDYDDLDFLYDSIYYLIKEEPVSDGEYIMQNHLFAFLYEVRHAYQGSRDIEIINNGIRPEIREWKSIKKKDVADNNLYYSFNYLLPDLVEDIILLRYFINKVNKKDRDICNPYINYVNMFYSIAVYRIAPMLTETQFRKIKKGLINSTILDSIFCHLWFEQISIDYASMNKEKRKTEIMHILDAIYNYGDYEDYYSLKLKIKNICKEENCSPDDLHYEEYPNEIEW